MLKSLQGHYDTPYAGDVMNTSKTAKGVPKTAKKKITFADYKHVLKESTVNTVTFRTIRGRKQKNETLEMKKRGLSAMDDKKYILLDGVNTLSYGHHRIPKYLEDSYLPEWNCDRLIPGFY